MDRKTVVKVQAKLLENRSLTGPRSGDDLPSHRALPLRPLRQQDARLDQEPQAREDEVRLPEPTFSPATSSTERCRAADTTRFTRGKWSTC